VAQKLFVVTGQKQLDNAMQQLKLSRAKAVVRKAARPALKPTLKAIRKNAPKRKRKRGQPRVAPVLSRAFRIRTLRKGRNAGAKITTLSDRFNKIFYGGFIEWGTRHIEARQFVKRSVDATKAESIAIFQRQVGKGIIREMRKVAKQ
jgi:HK97 gp10 family phage protein